MQQLKKHFIDLYGKHPEIAQIAKELNAIMARADAAWDAWDREAWSQALHDLRWYVPPDLRRKKEKP